ncbi:proteic killer suppression protein [Azotobacter beijerinckii]|uniref:Proteic killer suppression protein n=1 Tax=Azotobacter beijerinckii TaxID=170623 RepID=A0A1H6WSN5_9GAMM|nr:type II toxin-antitoxin system mRNA interferase toxin, RelE/StbE family [Azotobacter beijerinckii]SEJ15502.1 proteic killer suppression protein [Azotobacter beijerinckii]SFA96316.1 proteic killer suppression protein [Azotobacter beijerinckii]SFL46605.1 proteic killer suppression protein [Azotobacter beijerinckii]
MIKTFQHKGLKAYFETGSTKGIRADHAKRLTRVLGILDQAVGLEEINMPGFRLHQLKGDLAGFWSITISGNWRVIFRFVGQDVELLDYLDYH